MSAAIPSRTVLAKASALRSMVDAAAADPHAECCGVLLGQDGMIEIAVALPNEAPDPRASFSISASALAATARAHRARRDVIGFFHSHPNGSVLPSRTDLEHATGWPGYLHAIVATDGAAAPDLAIYRVASSSWDALRLEVRAA